MREGLRPAEDDLVNRAMSKLPPMSDEAFDAGRARLLAHMGKTVDTTVEAQPVALPQQRRRSRRVVWLTAAAVVVGVLALTLVGPTLVPKGDVDSGPEPRIGSAVAAEALSQAASKTGDVVLQPGQFLYVRDQTVEMASGSRGYDGIAWAYLSDETYETWVPADQGQTWEHRRTSSGNKTWLKGSPADLKDKPPMMVLGDWKASDGEFWGPEQASFLHPTPAYLAALPRDPKQLYEKLRSETAGNEGVELMRRISEGLDTGLIPADLRKAVYQALAYLPSLRLVDNTADLDGRQGTAFGVTGGRDSIQLVIDTRTGDYLGSRELLAADWDGLKAGTVTSSSALTSKVVGAMGQS